MLSTLVVAMVLGAEAAAVAVGATPSGTYHGSKSVLGSTIDITVTLESTTEADVKIAGPLTVDCDHEVYNYDGNTGVQLPNKDKAGDCIHDALAKAPGGGSLTSLVYAPDTDQITITAKIAFLSVSLVLSKAGSVVQVAEEHNGWFKEFSHFFSKKYTADEQPQRLQIFKDNLAKIEGINRGGNAGHHWPNQHADLSSEEFQALQFKA